VYRASVHNILKIKTKVNQFSSFLSKTLYKHVQIKELAKEEKSMLTLDNQVKDPLAFSSNQQAKHIPCQPDTNIQKSRK
jgi:hypothetical protein